MAASIDTSVTVWNIQDSTLVLEMLNISINHTTNPGRFLDWHGWFRIAMHIAQKRSTDMQNSAPYHELFIYKRVPIVSTMRSHWVSKMYAGFFVDPEVRRCTVSRRLSPSPRSHSEAFVSGKLGLENLAQPFSFFSHNESKASSKRLELCKVFLTLCRFVRNYSDDSSSKLSNNSMRPELF
jgi:hypothetical protein